LLGEFAPHLGDPMRQFVVGDVNPARELPSEAEFDLGGLQRLLHRLPDLGGRLEVRLGLAGGLGALPRRDALRDGGADEGHDAAQRREGRKWQAGDEGEHDHEHGRQQERPRVVAELADDSFFRRSPNAALGDQKARGQRHDQRRDLRHQAIADRQLGEHVGGVAERHLVPRHPEHDAP
jgi:hypothetical protein